MWKSRLIANYYTFIVLLADAYLPFVDVCLQLDMSLLISEDGQQPADPSKVVCTGAGLRWGYVNLPIRAEIDTRPAGPGEFQLITHSTLSL